VLFETAVLTEVVAVIGHVDDERVLFEPQAPQSVQHAADVPVEKRNGGVIRGGDAALVVIAEVAENFRDPPRVFRSDARDGETGCVEKIAVLGGKIEGRMRFLKTGPEREGFFAIGLQILNRLAGDVGTAGFLVEPSEREFVGVQPDPGWVAERLPLGGLGSDAGGERPRLYVARPRFRDFVLGHDDVEAVKAGLGRAVEVHLAEDGGPVSGFLKLLRKRGLIGRQWSGEHRHARGVRQLAGEERLAGRSADRRIAMMRRESHAFGGEAIQVGRPRESVAVATKHVSGMIVGEDEQKIGLAAGLRARVGE
jgi:hypothetical protein